MPRSMTGFGKGQIGSRLGNIIVEIRSVNHRFFDLTTRIPNHLEALEPKIKTEVRKRIRRGKVSLYLSYEKPEDVYEGLTIDKKVAFAYHKLLTHLKKDLNLSDEIRLDQIASFPNVITYKRKEESLGKQWPLIKKAVGQALDKLVAMREAEGKRLGDDIAKSLARIERALGKIKKRLTLMIDNYKARLSSRVKELTKGLEIDKNRLITEVAVFAERSDITEEVTRVASHLKTFRTSLARNEAMGKTLDFIIQELFRETNTISAKAGDYEISKAIINIKGELEKIREQVQNIE